MSHPHLGPTPEPEAPARSREGSGPGGATGWKLRSVCFFSLRIMVAAAIVTWLGWRHSRDLIAALHEIRPGWLVVALLLYAGQLLAGAWRWQLLLRVQELRLSFFAALSLTMQGTFFSLVMPSAIGGDVVKAGLLATRVPQAARLPGIFTILVDRMTGMIAMFAVAGTVGLCSLTFLRQLDGYLELTVQVLLGGCLTGLGAALALYCHRWLERFALVAALLKWADRMTRGAVTRFAAAADAFRTAWRTLLGCFLIGVTMIHLPVGLAVWCLVRGFGAESADPLLVILATSLGNTVGIIPATPAGVGTRDLVIKSLLVAGGIASGAALATTMVFTGMILGFNLLGGLFFVWRPQVEKR